MAITPPADGAEAPVPAAVPEAPKRRSDGRKARTRAAIIEAAGTLFSEQGFGRTTVEEIAAAANVSVGSIYVHFGGKEQLEIVLINRAMDINDTYIEEARQVESPLERVLNVGDAYLRFAREHTFAFRFVAMRPVEPGADGDGAVAQQLAARVAPIVAAIAGDLQQAMEAGEIDTIPVDEAIAFVWGAWNGVAGLMLRQDSLAITPEHAARTLELAKKVLIRGLRASA